MSKRICVVDDEAAIRDGLMAIFLAEGWQVDLYADAESCLEDLHPGLWDAALLDVRLPGMDGVKLMAKMAEKLPELPVLMISGHADVPVAVAAMRNGAADFIEKPFRAETVVRRVTELLALGAQGHAAAAGDLAQAFDRLSLTGREVEVARELVKGLTSKEIARNLDISPRTVDVHRRNILTKADARNTAELLAVLMR